MQYGNVSLKEGLEVSDELLERRLGLIRQAIVGLVRRDGPDLTARQLAVLLTTYLENESQTVRGLAAQLHVAKPAITRALDRLTEFDLVRRKQDPLDRRSVLVQRTAAGMTFLRELGQIVADTRLQTRISANPTA
jgi:DNA-binding MarR family transcriptional regulator